MRFRLYWVVSFMLVAYAVHAQPIATLAGEIRGWQDGEAQLVPLGPRHVPPPRARPADTPTIGLVAADGTFTATISEPFAEEAFVPVPTFLDPGCTDARATPEDAGYVPVALGVYGPDEVLIGEIFQASPGAGAGPEPGEYTILYGFSREGFALRGACPDASRRVVEDYDFRVEAGWHEIVQRFSEHPDRAGWRIDRWRNEPLPADAVWIMIRPPE